VCNGYARHRARARVAIANKETSYIGIAIGPFIVTIADVRETTDTEAIRATRQSKHATLSAFDSGWYVCLKPASAQLL